MRLRRFHFPVAILCVAWTSAAPLAAFESRLTSLPAGLESNVNPVTMEHGARPLVQVLEDLSLQAGLAMSVGAGLEEQKITVRFSKLPLSYAARALAAATDGVWRATRSEIVSEVKYRLDPSPARVARLQEYRSARREASIRRDRVALESLLSRLDERRLPSDLKPPGAPRNVALADYPAPLFSIIRNLPTAVLEQWIQNANESFRFGQGAAPEKTPGIVIPASLLPAPHQEILSGFMVKLADEIQRYGTPDVLKSAETCRSLAQHLAGLQLQLWACRFTHAVKGQEVQMYLRLVAPGVNWAFDLPLRDSPYVPLPNAEEAADRTLGAPQSQDRPEASRKLNLTFGPARLDRGLIEVARAAGVNLAADYYTKPGVLSVFGQQRPLRAVLEEAERTFKLTHFWLGSTLIVRSRDWVQAYDAEPPAALLDRWDEKRKKQGILGLDDYLAAATALDERKIATLVNHTGERGERLYMREVVELARHRHVLRGYAALSTVQRNQAGTDGVPVGGLSQLQLDQWRAALQPFLFLPPEALRRARLRVIPSTSVAEPLPKFLLMGVPALPAVELVSTR